MGDNRQLPNNALQNINNPDTFLDLFSKFNKTREQILDQYPELADLYKQSKAAPLNQILWIQFLASGLEVYSKEEEMNADPADKIIIQLAKTADLGKADLMNNYPELRDAYDVAKEDPSQLGELRKIANSVLGQEQHRQQGIKMTRLVDLLKKPLPLPDVNNLTDPVEVLKFLNQHVVSVKGTLDHDVIRGTNENDTFGGGIGNDVLYGNDGHDILSGGAENDTIYGNNGNDTISGGAGTDIIHGGSGNNSYINYFDETDSKSHDVIHLDNSSGIDSLHTHKYYVIKYNEIKKEAEFFDIESNYSLTVKNFSPQRQLNVVYTTDEDSIFAKNDIPDYRSRFYPMSDAPLQVHVVKFFKENNPREIFEYKTLIPGSPEKFVVLPSGYGLASLTGPKGAVAPAKVKIMDLPESNHLKTILGLK